MNYYYSIDGTDVTGPYSIAELEELLDKGVISPDTDICPEGTQKWRPLRQLIPDAAAVLADQASAKAADRAGSRRLVKLAIAIVLVVVALVCLFFRHQIWH